MDWEPLYLKRILTAGYKQEPDTHGLQGQPRHLPQHGANQRVNLYHEDQVHLINVFENLHTSVHPHQLLTASMHSNKVVDISQYNTTGIVVLSVLQHAAQAAKWMELHKAQLTLPFDCIAAVKNQPAEPLTCLDLPAWLQQWLGLPMTCMHIATDSSSDGIVYF